MCSCHRLRLGGGRRRRGPKRRPVPAGARARELTREVNCEGAEAAVRVGVVVQGVARGPPGGLLLDEGVGAHGGVRGQRGVRGNGGVKVQDGSPLRGRADGQSRAAGAGARRERGQQGVQVTGQGEVTDV